MLLIRAIYKTLWKAGQCINVPLARKYGVFHFPESVEIRIGEQLYVTKPNAVIVYGPGVPRWIYFPRDTQFDFFHATMEVRQLLEKYEIPLGCILYPKNPETLSNSFRRLRMEYLSNSRYHEDMQDVYVREHLICLSRGLYEPETVPEGKLQMQFLKLRLEILSQPEKRWNVPAMAKALSLSPSRFHVVYKSMFRITPTQDLILARVERAKELLLENPGEDLTALAEKLGYNNPYDFSRQFKRVAGVSPGAYRKNNQ